ncbi:MAG: DUF599 family protein [Pseudomonadota bacterium]
MMQSIPLPDWLALGFFVFVCVFFTWYADHSKWSLGSLPRVMDFHRRRWMGEMLKREMRMPDALVLGNFVHSAVFFASTAILVLGGLVAVLGASERALIAISALPFVSTPSQEQWALKVVTLICVYIYAFVKFIWAVRLANYSSVLFNAAPLAGTAQSERYADELGKIAGLFGMHFNQGLRANFFSLAVLGWLINAWVFAVATCLVLGVLYRREFRSKSLRVAKNLRDLCAVNEPDA